VTPLSGTQNSYASTKVTGTGTTVAGNPFAFSTGGLFINGGNLLLNGNSFTFANLTGTTGSIQNGGSSGPSTITVGTDGSSTSYGGTLVDGTASSLGLTKTGNGVLTLTGTNTYTGVTTFSGGVLSVATIGNGGFSSNLGAATNDPANILFDSGTLRYTGVTASTNRGFTFNPAASGTIEVVANTLTISGDSPRLGRGLDEDRGRDARPQRQHGEHRHNHRVERQTLLQRDARHRCCQRRRERDDGGIGHARSRNGHRCPAMGRWTPDSPVPANCRLTL